jgi:hypothetical protein
MEIKDLASNKKLVREKIHLKTQLMMLDTW